MALFSLLANNVAYRPWRAFQLSTIKTLNWQEILQNGNIQC